MDFVEKAKDIFEKSAKVSKKAVSKAGDAIQEFSDKSILKIEIKKLENERKSVYAELGEYTASFLTQAESVSKTDEKISGYLNHISQLNEKLSENEKKLSEV